MMDYSKELSAMRECCKGFQDEEKTFDMAIAALNGKRVDDPLPVAEALRRLQTWLYFVAGDMTPTMALRRAIKKICHLYA